MKNMLLPFVLTLVSFTFAKAQENTAPRTEYTVQLSATALTLAPGTEQDVTLTLNRSKSFSKSKATFGLSSALPEGVTVTYQLVEGVVNSTLAKIQVAPATKPGNYLLILKTTIQQKSKGATLKLVVSASGEAVSMN